MNDLRTVTLAEAGVTLIDCIHKTPMEINEGFVYISIPQMKDGHLKADGARRISENDFKIWTEKANPQPHDVVLSRRCNPGITAHVPANNFRFALGQNLVLLRADGNTIYPPFLRWICRGTEWWDQVNKFINVGAVFDSLKCREIPKFKVSIPAIQEQKAIAHILGTLDDKIELNRQTNKTLESIAQAIFKSWFVDFDPVKAKRDGNTADLSLSPDILDLFPDSFQDSEKGKIPAGWEVSKISDSFEINPRRILKTGKSAKYLDMKNMPTDGARAFKITRRELNSGSKFINGDTLLARITPCLENGKTAFVDFLDNDEVGWGSTEYIVLRPKQPLPVEYGYFLARDKFFRDHAILNMTGSSGRQRVQLDCFNSFSIAVPNKNICELFANFAQTTLQSIKANDEESTTLKELRDTLLPKLISGELRIKDAEKFLKDAPL